MFDFTKNFQNKNFKNRIFARHLIARLIICYNIFEIKKMLILLDVKGEVKTTLKGIVYHGSMEDNIEILTPQIGTHQKKCVYATRNKCVALLFANRGNKDLDTIIKTINGKLIVVERREGLKRGD